MQQKNRTNEAKKTLNNIVNKLKRTHYLEELLDKMVVHDPSFEAFREITQKATAFYFLESIHFLEENLEGMRLRIHIMNR